MKSKNHNIRFNMEKGDECRAWELLHSPQVRQMFKSQNRFVIEAVNDYYDRCVAMKNDPYLETREKEDAFAERIVEVVEKKVMSNLPALFGMYMAQMQVFPLSVPMGAYSVAQGGMVYGQAQTGALSSGTNPQNMATQDAEDTQGQDKQESVTEPPDNELIDFDAF
ncbi:hypothetical protein VSQ32_06975 [Lachnospiraceae bacterium KK002]